MKLNMKLASRILLAAILILALSLTLTHKAQAMAQISLQNNTKFWLKLYIDGNFGCGPVMPSGFCISSVKPGSHLLEAKKGEEVVSHESGVNIGDGTSPTWTVTIEEEEKKGPRETGRDGRFIAYEDGTVLDTSTNLMWAAKDNGSFISWQNAKSFCENYRGGGYTDWRMPTGDELAGLYDENKTYRSDCGWDVYLTKLIHLTCCCPWLSGTSKPGYFVFGGSTRVWDPQAHGDGRALPVRSAK